MHDAASITVPGESGACFVVAVCGMSFEADIAAGPGVVTLRGVGTPGLLEQMTGRLEGWLAHNQNQCRGIISFGCAGGLDPALPPGACVLADEIVTATARFSCDPDWLRALQGCVPQAVIGPLAGVDQPVLDAADKMRLRQDSGACAVDMESHQAAMLAQHYAVPFAACRIIVDPAHRSLPAAAMAGLREDGTTSFMRVVRALAARPGQLPALLRLAADAGAAKRTMRAVRSRMGAAFALPSPSR